MRAESAAVLVIGGLLLVQPCSRLVRDQSSAIVTVLTSV